MSDTTKPSTDLPQESDWHRRISEAAYFLAEKRGFHGGYSLDDWLAAEQDVRRLIAHQPKSESMTNPIRTPAAAGEDSAQTAGSPQAPQQRPEPAPASNFAKFAATQAAADGIEGNVQKPDKTVDDKIAANMADRK